VLILAALFVFTACASVFPRRTRRVELRVLVWNIHAGRDAAGQRNLERVAALVKQRGIDIVLLQEIDSLTTRSGGEDQANELARLSGLHVRFGNALAYQGGGYGVATLTRWKPDSSRLVRLNVSPPQARSGGSTEPRGALRVHLSVPSGGPLVIYNTHWDASRTDTNRVQEAGSFLEDAARQPGNVLLGGDLNSEPGSRPYLRITEAGFRDLWPGCGAGDGLTFPVAKPVKRIDYLLSRGIVRCVGASVMADSASDHRGVEFTVLVP